MLLPLLRAPEATVGILEEDAALGKSQNGL